jgi:pimeloyl-ACP methyl ester carboxylesterase
VRSALAAVLLLSALAASAEAQPVTPAFVPHVEIFGSGPPLVALHGFGGSTYSWHSIREELSASHTVYAFDLKGFGQSPKPRDGRYSVHDQAAWIIDYIAARHLTNITLLGHSFGGGVALAVAVELEEQQPGVLSKLILIDAASYPQKLPWFINTLRWPIIGPLSQRLLTSRKQVKMVLEYAYFDKARITQEQIESYAAPLRMPGGKYALRETAKQIVPKDIADLSSRYSHIMVPTLILWGEGDRVVPAANGVRLSKAIPHSTLVTIPKCGHIPHEEMPDAVRKPLADFLR